MEMVNLTPHPINIIIGEEKKVIPPSGIVARCEEKTETIGKIGQIPIIRKSFGEVKNLPDPKKGIIYIVSSIVAQAVKGREDVYCPGDPVRNREGQIIGCRSLCKI